MKVSFVWWLEVALNLMQGFGAENWKRFKRDSSTGNEITFEIHDLFPCAPQASSLLSNVMLTTEYQSILFISFASKHAPIADLKNVAPRVEGADGRMLSLRVIESTFSEASSAMSRTATISIVGWMVLIEQLSCYPPDLQCWQYCESLKMKWARSQHNWTPLLALIIELWMRDMTWALEFALIRSGEMSQSLRLKSEATGSLFAIGSVKEELGQDVSLFELMLSHTTVGHDFNLERGGQQQRMAFLQKQIGTCIWYGCKHDTNHLIMAESQRHSHNVSLDNTLVLSQRILQSVYVSKVMKIQSSYADCEQSFIVTRNCCLTFNPTFKTAFHYISPDQFYHFSSIVNLLSYE